MKKQEMRRILKSIIEDIFFEIETKIASNKLAEYVRKNISVLSENRLSIQYNGPTVYITNDGWIECNWGQCSITRKLPSSSAQKLLDQTYNMELA